MKQLKFLKTSSLLIAALVACGAFFFLTSASSVEDSNTQTISKLSKDLTEMSAKLTDLKAKKSEAAVISSEPFIGEIAAFGFNFAPRGWAQCNGQLLSISQNTALFSLLGTTYGGDGRTTFGLPDLRGRVALHQGTGPGLTPHNMGAKFGVENSYVRTTRATAGPGGGRGDVNVVSDITNGGMINVIQPSLVVNYCIATVGIFPSRN